MPKKTTSLLRVITEPGPVSVHDADQLATVHLYRARGHRTGPEPETKIEMRMRPELKMTPRETDPVRHAKQVLDPVSNHVAHDHATERVSGPVHVDGQS